MTETSGNLALKKESDSKLALPAIRTRFSSAGCARCIVVLRQKRQFNATNLHLYHYAGNNPVRYTDPDGRAPRNLTEAERNLYKTSVQSQHPANISNKYDCADTVLHIYTKAMEAANGTKNAYTNINKNGQKLDNLQNIQAADMFGDANKKNKIVNYYQSDGTQSYDSSSADRSFNSSNIEIGTVGIYKPADGASGFTGHSITVTGVTRDKNGSVTSINYIEGHMGENGAEQEEHIFTRESGLWGSSSLQNRYSNCEFVGWGEIE